MLLYFFFLIYVPHYPHVSIVCIGALWNKHLLYMGIQSSPFMEDTVGTSS